MSLFFHAGGCAGSKAHLYEAPGRACGFRVNEILGTGAACRRGPSVCKRFHPEAEDVRERIASFWARTRQQPRPGKWPVDLAANEANLCAEARSLAAAGEAHGVWSSGPRPLTAAEALAAAPVSRAVVSRTTAVRDRAARSTATSEAKAEAGAGASAGASVEAGTSTSPGGAVQTPARPAAQAAREACSVSAAVVAARLEAHRGDSPYVARLLDEPFFRKLLEDPRLRS